MKEKGEEREEKKGRIVRGNRKGNEKLRLKILTDRKKLEGTGRKRLKGKGKERRRRATRIKEMKNREEKENKKEIRSCKKLRSDRNKLEGIEKMEGNGN